MRPSGRDYPRPSWLSAPDSIINYPVLRSFIIYDYMIDKINILVRHIDYGRKKY